MSTPFDRINTPFRPPSSVSTSMPEVKSALKELHAAADPASKLIDTFMKEGVPKTVTGNLLGKLGLFGNLVNGATSGQEAGVGAMAANGIKIFGAIAPRSLANIADGIGNGLDLAKGASQGDMQKVMSAGMKLCLNLAASGSAPGMLLISAGEMALETIKNKPADARLHNQETQRLMRSGVDDNYIGA